MTTRQYQPSNDNLLQLSKFQFGVPGLPFENYFCQTANLPGVRTEAPVVENPFSQTFRHGDKMFFDPLVLTVLVDEDLRCWEEAMKWLVSLTFPHKFEEYASAGDLYREAVLMPTKNSNIANFKIKYHHCHPVSISGIEFDTRVPATTIPTFTLTLRYDTFEIERF